MNDKTNDLREAALARARGACAESGWSDTSIPFVDGWMALWRSGRGGSVSVNVNCPTEMHVSVERWADDYLMANLRIGGVTFRHQPKDMRLMLLAALEWLDLAEAEAEQCSAEVDE